MKARHFVSTQWTLAGIVCGAIGFHLWGIRLQLPFLPEVDEPEFVTRAVRMAASGRLNPQWFGHPGSTVIYPLAALYHLWNAIAHNRSLLHSDPTLQVDFTSSPNEYYLLGRLLSVMFAVLTVSLVYAIGRRAFCERVGLVGASLFVLYPIAVSHAQMVRTDSAATFFGMFSLWLCLRAYHSPTIGTYIATGFSTGLSIATKYFMVALIPIVLATHKLTLKRSERTETTNKITKLNLGAALLAMVVAFALSTPYFFLDFERAIIDLNNEAEVTHLGADGLSPLGNLLWYLTQAIPQSITWLQTLLFIIGILLIMSRRDPQQLLLLGFVGTFLVEISLLSLHWQRWVIQILPLLALFVAYALDLIVRSLTSRRSVNISGQRMLLLTVILFVTVVPAYQLVALDIREFNPTTRILAREWILQNLPSESQIAQEWYTAPLAVADFAGYAQNRYSQPSEASGFFLFERFSLAQNRKLEDYYTEGYRYVVVSSAIYGRYLAEPQRYPAENTFYQNLFEEAYLLKQFDPSTTRGGPIIRVYELKSAQ